MPLLTELWMIRPRELQRFRTYGADRPTLGPQRIYEAGRVPSPGFMPPFAQDSEALAVTDTAAFA